MDGLTRVLISLALAASAVPVTWGTLPPGPHAAGFSSESMGASSDAVGLSVWYPAAGAGRPGTVADYLRLAEDLRGVPPRFTSSRDGLVEALAVSVSGRFDRSQRSRFERLLDAPVFASFDAPRAAGRFPLVLWSPRYATVVAQAPLSEFLASRGYVVAAIRPAGTALRMPFEAKDDASKRETLDAQVAAMAAARDRVLERFPIDSSRMAVLAWSYAGESATRFQMRERSVRLVAGLSTNHLSNWVYGATGDLEQVDPSTLTAAYVMFTERAGTTGEVRQPPAIMSALPGDGWFVSFQSMAHGNFNALEGFWPALFGIREVQPWARPGRDAAAGYATTVRMTGAFVDHYLKGTPLDLGSVGGHAANGVVVQRTAGARPR